MKTMIRFVLLVFIIGTILLTACSGPEGEGNKGIITIRINGSVSRTVLPPGVTDLSQLDHTIKVVDKSGKNQGATGVKEGSSPVSFEVALGSCTITVEAFLGSTLVAYGSTVHIVTPGPNGSIQVKMGAPGGVLTTNSIQYLDVSSTITKTYGDPKFTNSVDPAHFGSGVISYSSSTPAVATVNSSNGEVTILKAGNTVIEAEKAEDRFYTDAQTQYTLVVDKATLTVTADNKIIDYNDPVPSYTYSLSGFLNGDTQSVVSGTPGLACAYTLGSAVGSYPITATLGTLSAENYNFIMADGAVSVGLKNQPSLTINAPGAKNYGDPIFTLSTTGGAGSGLVTYTIETGNDVIGISGAVVNIIKAGSATVKATKAGDSGYNPIDSNTITIMVGKRNLSDPNVTVTPSTPQTYTGISLTPAVVVSDVISGTEMITASDYSILGYANNTDAGTTASVSITASASGNYTGTNTSNFTIYQAAGAAVSGAPTVNGTPTSTSITVNAVTNTGGTGQTVEYAISATTTSPSNPADWQTGLTFNALNPAVGYYAFARTRENTNYLAGTEQMSSIIQTAYLYTVTFVTNGGTAVSPIGTNGAGISSPANPTYTLTPIGANTRFRGWYTDNGIFATAYTFGTAVSGDIILYADWGYRVGDTGPGGGKVYYRDNVGFTMTGYVTPLAHYLEVAPADRPGTYMWMATTAYIFPVYSRGSGWDNTNIILTAEPAAPAAAAARAENSGGLSDWFLPSQDELIDLYLVYDSIAGIGLDPVLFYWTSSAADSTNTWAQPFKPGGNDHFPRGNSLLVRAIRAF